ncbi:MAG: methionine biosynthesis protein MetW [Candidatus Nitrotoga sp.]|jgi:methionine biosynthesis protein MetW|nr:methionine biosynthesis protein MetW [Candidatus Nitrotoga sp.]MDW7625331.1 methionine biosynthesis protein MetW [Candidatus Nitrotoga sp.]
MSTHDHSTLTLTRPDFAAIAAWIPKGARVLDLGCGDGSLLRYLQGSNRVAGYGVEIVDANIVACIKNQVNVIQGDLESGLSGFENNSFDYVILSQTLQATRHTEPLMREMLRVGREGIVSFPNFGYWRNRMDILQGKMPVSKELPYQWYDTPNIHLCTLNDFEALCRSNSMHILDRRVMTGDRVISVLPNLLGSTAVYRFKRTA